MKKYILTLCLALAVSICLISCGDNSEKPKTPENVGGIENVLGDAVPEEAPAQPEEPVKKAAEVNKAAYDVAENMQWSFDSGVLTITGNGKMPEHRMSSEWPWAEYSDKVTKIVIEEGIQSVGVSAFYGFSKVKEVVLPESLRFIDTCGFGDCFKLTSIVIPEGTLSIGQDAFDACFYIENVTLPSTLLRIEENAFSSCDEMTSIILPEGLEFLGEAAFYSSPLEEITLPSTLVEVEDEVFTNSYNLKSITLNCEVDMPNIFSQCKKIENVNCGSYYVYEDGILYNKDKTVLIGAIDETITSVTIPDSVEKISSHAFSNTALTSVAIPSSVKVIGTGAFISCKSLGSVTLGDGLEFIDEFAFAFCEALHELSIPESVKNIEYGAFRGCTINVNVASAEKDISFNSDDFSHSTITVNYAE